MKLTAERLYVGLVTIALLAIAIYNLATVPNKDMVHDMELRLENCGDLDRLDGNTYVYSHWLPLTQGELTAIERLQGYYTVIVVDHSTVESLGSIPLIND